MSCNFSNINENHNNQEQKNQQPFNMNINIKDLDKSSLLLEGQTEDTSQSPFNTFSSTYFYLF